jgi:hypothetical protein
MQPCRPSGLVAVAPREGCGGMKNPRPTAARSSSRDHLEFYPAIPLKVSSHSPPPGQTTYLLSLGTPPQEWINYA